MKKTAYFKRNGCLKIIIFIAFLMSTGCSTISHFHSIPTENTDFQLSTEEIKKKYSDIEYYEKRFRGFHSATPALDELIGYWGAPQSVKRNWGSFAGQGFILPLSSVLYGTMQPGAIALGTVLLLRPAPITHYYWSKGNYNIDVTVDGTVDHGYVDRMLFWRWDNIAESSKTASRVSSHELQTMKEQGDEER